MLIDMADNYIEGYAIITPYDCKSFELSARINEKRKLPLVQADETMNGTVIAKFEGEKEKIQSYINEIIFPMKLVKQINPLSTLEMRVLTK